MRKIIRIALVVAIALSGLSLLYAACKSTSLAPAPPAELPAPVVLKFVEPEDLRIDTSSLDIASASISKALGVGDDFLDPISFGAEAQRLFDELLIPLLGGISTLEFPISETLTSFHETVDFGTPDPTISPDVYLQGVRDVKISFADFDFNGDGTSYGCSGHTAALPICIRMWIDDESYLAWVFDTYPFPDDPTTPEDEAIAGQGKFKLFFYDIDVLFIGADLAMRLDYDFEDLPNKSVEGYESIADADAGYAITSHLSIEQEGPDASALKRIADYVEIAGAGPEDGVGNYIAQYREGYDFWSGSFLANTPDDFIDQCAQISTYTGVANTNCDDVGGMSIRVTGLPFIDPFDPADVAVPTDFPLNPPAGMFTP